MSSSVVDEIKQRLDIVEVIGQTVPLRKSGRTYVGFCPFHRNTRTPAFHVFPDTQSFYCFGCQASGTVFDFIMRSHGSEFHDALETLAHRAGIELTPPTPEKRQENQRRTKLLEIAATAANYLSFILLQTSQGEAGRRYLEKRGISRETIEHFQLGYAPNEWTHLYAYLVERKGYQPEDVEATGLTIQRQKSGWYDRFRGRLIFPIRDAKERVVGFGGRALDDSQPKYLNTPQTDLFDKGRILYGLDRARDAIRKEDATIVVEGYIDVITAHQCGFGNVVAPLGTSLTKGHIGLLKRLSQHIILALDSDSAGQQATLRSIEALQQTDETDEGSETVQPMVSAQGLIEWQRDVSLQIVKMPPGSDPDDVIRQNPQQWQKLVSQAVPVVEFYIDAYTADLNLSTAQGQRHALDRLIPLIARLDSVQQRVYIAKLEHVIGVRAELILDLLRQTTQPKHSPRTGSRQGDSRRSSSSSSSPSSSRRPHAPMPDQRLLDLSYRAPAPPPSLEDYMLALMLRYPSTKAVVQETINYNLESFPRAQSFLTENIETLFEMTENRLIWLLWQKAGTPKLTSHQGNNDKLRRWAQSIDKALHTQIEQLASLTLPRPTEYRYNQEAERCAKRLRMEQTKRLLRSLTSHLNELDDAEEMRQRQQLLVELSHYRAHIGVPPQSRSFLDIRNLGEHKKP